MGLTTRSCEAVVDGPLRYNYCNKPVAGFASQSAYSNAYCLEHIREFRLDQSEKEAQ